MRGRRTRSWRATAILLSALPSLFSASREGLAQTRAPTPITKSDYGLDLFQGPVTTASRVIGLAGAYTALAEWCEGEYSNAASPAVRAPYSLGKWDVDLCLGFTNPGSLSGNDFENRGTGYSALPTRFSNSVTYNLGLQVQYGTVGITIDFDELRLGLQQDVNVRQTSDSVVIDRVTGSIANAFLDEQLVIGVGFRVAKFALEEQLNSIDHGVLFSGGGTTQVGAILKPKGSRFRIGATLRSEIDVDTIKGTSQLPDGSQVIDGKILPSHIVAPSEIEIGGALELGQRPMNPRRVNAGYSEDAIRAHFDQKRLDRAAAYEKRIALTPEADRERMRRSIELQELRIEDEEDREAQHQLDALVAALNAQARLWDRREMMLLFGVLITGATPDSVGISDFLTQRRIPSGERTAISPRLGFETEALRNWLVVRGGTYIEPSRYADSSARGHFTAGVDIRLFKFNPFGLLGDDPWRLRLAGDMAPRYFNWALALGKYH